MKRPFLTLLLCAGVLSANAQTYSLSGEFSSMGTTNLSLETNNTARITVLSTSGFTGIGITGPTESLDISGTARFRAVPANNALTQLLVTDATGKVFWRDVSSLTSSISNIPFVISATSTIGVGGGTLINSIGQKNSGFGYNALAANTSGYENTAFGSYSMYSTTTGSDNTAIGNSSLYANTTGAHNTAIGNLALSSSTTSNGTVAIGHLTLNALTAGNSNTAVGAFAMTGATTGNNNTAVGSGASRNTTTGVSNVSVGASSLYYNITGSSNTAIGSASGPAFGHTDLQNTTAIGYGANVTASNTVRIGNSSVTSIGGQVSWSTLSDGRFKTDIREDVSGLEFIKQLRPVSYAFDKKSINNFLGVTEEIEGNNFAGRPITPRQTGFIAQEVAEVVKRTGYVFHGVEAPQNDKDHYSIRYAEFVVPLVKAVQELNATVEAQRRKIDLLMNMNKEFAGKELTDDIILFQNNPNPFSAETEIRMNIPDRVQTAELLLYDLSGKQLGKISIQARGSVTYKIDAGTFKSGMYLYTLITDNAASETKRMILTD